MQPASPKTRRKGTEWLETFKPLIVGLAAAVILIMLIDCLDGRLYLERHRTSWVLVQLMFFAFGLLLHRRRNCD